MEGTDIDPQWRKASYSNGGENCVEAGNGNGMVLVRDTTDRQGFTLAVPASAWASLVASVKQQ